MNTIYVHIIIILCLNLFFNTNLVTEYSVFIKLFHRREDINKKTNSNDLVFFLPLQTKHIIYEKKKLLYNGSVNNTLVEKKKINK